MNKIGYKKFFKTKISEEGKLIVPISFFENGQISRGGIKKGFTVNIIILKFKINLYSNKNNIIYKKIKVK